MADSISRRPRVAARFTALVAASAALLIGSLAHVSADHGLSRDPAFGSSGRVLVADVNATAGLFDMTSQSDGRILVAAVGGNDSIRRYRANGAPDPTFALNGTLQFPNSIGLAAWWLPIDPAKPIMALVSTPIEGSYLLRRHLASGALDTTFGVGGEVSVDVEQSSTRPLLTVAPSGAITVTTNRRPTFSTQTTTLQRFTADGASEVGFGTGGTAVLDGVSGEPIGVDAAGVMTLVHNDRFDFTTSVVRVTAGGSVDVGYGANGFAQLRGNIDNTFAIARTDGTVTATSRQYDGGFVVRVERLTAAGTPDSSFGNGGITELLFRSFQPNYGPVNSDEFAIPRNLVALDRGRVGVLLNSFGVSAAAILRADGSADPSFGVAGQAILSNDVRLIAGDITSAGGVEFLGAAANSAPLYLQRSLDNAPWPPTSPAPANLTAATTVESSGQNVLTSSWSPVVNPDPEVFDFGYDVKVERGRTELSSFFTEELTARTFLPGPGTYTVTVTSRNMYGAGLSATASVTIQGPTTTTTTPRTPDRLDEPAGGTLRPATRLACVAVGTSRPVLQCTGTAGR